MMEILAPVGNQESLVAAVRAGADAVYLGFGQFNARRNAENFSDDSFSEAVAYCHVRGVKVYLTLNTLLYKNELSSAVGVAQKAARVGVDGIICADLGLAGAIYEALPEVPLHASTQMTVHTKEALPLLKELGFCRVVPSREMTRSELEDFTLEAEKLGISVEVFLHGALCMCMSGQCLMSAHLGGRSGNRGLCAGTCRLPFGANDPSEYALSLRDLSLIPHIPTLRKMGVASLKIEGRMKSPEYVAVAVSAAREMVDTGTVSAEKQRLLESIFSRNGFTDGYFENKIGRNLFGRRTDDEVILSTDNKTQSHELYRTERQSVKISAKLTALENEALRLSLSDGENTVMSSGNPPERAMKIASTEEFLKEKLDKFGGTPFKLEQTQINLGEGLSVRARDLNALRREAVERLLDARRTKTEISEHKYEPRTAEKRLPAKPKAVLQFRAVPSKKLLSELSGIEADILPAEALSQEIRATLPKDVRLIADIPAGMSQKNLIDEAFALAESFADALICRNLAAVEIARKRAVPFIVGSELGVLNDESHRVLEELGAKASVLSLESKKSDGEFFSGKIGMYLYGKTRLMLTRACPIKLGDCKGCRHKIIDRKGVEFPVLCRAGFTEIYNDRPLYLGDRLEEFRYLDFYILAFLDESEDEIQDIVKQYLDNSPKLPVSYTRGLYGKGVY